ncbi:unnamed protein product [Urochloa decumbens]|uniref:DUF4220 domain-containing protein n=1 Tax=Urochloa decumbens TaxID=240449 RepID=A0ABC8WAT0_9POAL
MRAIPGWLRFILWLAYHGSDAVAIYALATLYNRHRDDEGDGGVGGGTLLEVVWAPVLLIHLGGQDGVTAYNIEDNELWSRHLLTAVSQVAVAVYVFCKSWPPGGDKRLLAAAILLFVLGFVKCLAKARAFKRASIYSLVSSSGAAAKEKNDGNMYNSSSALKEYVKHARHIVIRQQQSEADHHQVEVIMEEEEDHEAYSAFLLLMVTDGPTVVWPETVNQYSLAGYFVRNKKHSIMMQIVSLLQCKDFLDQLWLMEPCFSSARITHLVLGYLKDGWKLKIQDAASYRSFNNHSSHWGLNMNRPFDECVLLWHLATDFCFFSTSFPDHTCAFAEPPAAGKCTSAAKNPTSTTTMRPQCSKKSAVCKAVQCRQMSNYMVYLLSVNPEMLLPGSRRHPFKTAYDELKDILRDWEWNPVCWSRCTPCGVKLIKEEEIVMKGVIAAIKQKSSEKRAPTNKAIVTDTAITVTQQRPEEGNFIDQAWALAQSLWTMDETKMWEEIQGVWVEMLCFSASRCRGYLHAKALGKGGELLSYVWLLLFYVGMETFTDKLKREDLLSHEHGNHAGAPLASEVHTHAGASAAPSTSEICMAS